MTDQQQEPAAASEMADPFGKVTEALAHFVVLPDAGHVGSGVSLDHMLGGCQWAMAADSMTIPQLAEFALQHAAACRG
jgi:hypothetical protein